MPKKTKRQVIKLIRFLKDWLTGAQKLLRRPGIEPGSTAWKGSYAHHYTTDAYIYDQVRQGNLSLLF